jgi:hypothetical protein
MGQAAGVDYDHRDAVIHQKSAVNEGCVMTRL